ncbi:tyrosine-type recombinase/integrase [Actinokineospora sp. HUAS TT18]|uniref:tyrosine-type recombinase/integrase n=1 Tax=Actinokineospora sp. HUAS TT18 TaxID=3447451 RepID=UPI003F527F2B
MTLVPHAEVWPGVTDPARLLAHIADWLLGYANRATRTKYAESLGLPVSTADLEPWRAHPDLAAVVPAYAHALGIPTTQPTPTRTPPPARRGRLRHLHWLRWCAAHGVDPLRANTTHVKEWLDDLTDQGAAKATRDRMLGTLKALYAHLAEAGVIAANPAALSRRRLNVATDHDTTRTVTLTADQVRALLTAAATPRPGRDRLGTRRATAVVALFTLGIRVSELCDLTRADLHSTRGRTALRVPGKGDKPRIVYLSGLANDALNAYLHERSTDTAPARRGHVKAGTEPLVATRDGTPMARADVWALLRRVAASAGPDLADVATRIHPHALRHFYVTAAVEAGAELVTVQADVGHASVDTTNRTYNSAARDPGRSAVDLVADLIRGEG